jgi:hypothetical protein
MSCRTLKRCVAFLAIASAILAVLSGCGSSGEAETTSEVERPSADPPVYHQTAYDLETGWVQVASDEKVGDYLHTVWHDFASDDFKMVIDSRPAAGAPPPMTAAELARVQASWLPKYKELSLKRVKLGRRPAVRFAYFGAGQERIEYFFEECGTSIIFRGSAEPAVDNNFPRYYATMASNLKLVCDE